LQYTKEWGKCGLFTSEEIVVGGCGVGCRGRVSQNAIVGGWGFG